MSAEMISRKAKDQLTGLFNSHRDKIEKSLPEGVNLEKVIQALLFAVQGNEELAKCSTASLFTATIQAMHLGINPFDPRKLGYLIPYNNKKKDESGKDKWVKEAQFMPSYMGLIDLANRSGRVKKIYARTVYEHDFFHVELGTNESIEHRPAQDAEGRDLPRGNAIKYYAVVIYVEGHYDFEVMRMNEIMSIKDCSKAKNSPAWRDHFDEMAKKCPLRRLSKRVSMSINDNRYNKAVALDNQIAAGERQDFNIIDVDVVFTEDELESHATATEQVQGLTT